jgi:hypothetical protein
MVGFYFAVRGQSTCITSEFASGGLANALTSLASYLTTLSMAEIFFDDHLSILKILFRIK